MTWKTECSALEENKRQLSCVFYLNSFTSSIEEQFSIAVFWDSEEGESENAGMFCTNPCIYWNLFSVTQLSVATIRKTNQTHAFGVLPM